jgi:hypothetical protein
MFGENPFQEPSHIIAGRVNFHGKDLTRMIVSCDLISVYVDLIKEMFQEVPEQRITLEGIKAHPWLARYF